MFNIKFEFVIFHSCKLGVNMIKINHVINEDLLFYVALETIGPII